MSDHLTDDDAPLFLARGRDEFGVDVLITVTDDNVEVVGSFIYQNIDDLKGKIMSALPEGKRDEYAHTAGLVALCLIANTYGYDITQEVHDKFCRSEAAWHDCMDLSRHFDHYAAATGSEWQVDDPEEGVFFYTATKEKP